jgi:hypothetical protein
MTADAVYRNGLLEDDFAGGRHRFRLAIGQLEELQELTKVGPLALWNRLNNGTWFHGDIRELIRLGLIGAGMDPWEAQKMRDRYADVGALLPHVPLAIGIISVALNAPKDETLDDAVPPGEPMTAEAATEDQKSSSPSPTSTGTES